MTYSTYSPDDNKLRIYPASRLDAETYARVKAAGFSWAPKQECFYAQAWSPEREDLARELSDDKTIEDEDRSLMDRAAERAERFEGYEENRERDAQHAHAAVESIAGRFEFGQPILIGHHSERKARKDQERMHNAMTKAVKAFETAEYWKRRAASALAHARYKETPAVRARRIKTIEAERRKLDRRILDAKATVALFELIDRPEKWKKRDDGSELTREERALHIAGRVHLPVIPGAAGGTWWTAYDLLRPAEERYKDCPAVTVDAVIQAARDHLADVETRSARWIAHYENRLAYERAMLDEQGGTEADRTKPEKGGAVRCWVGRGYWLTIQKVNKISVTVLDSWGEGSRTFNRTVPFDKLQAIMSAGAVAEARAAGLVVDLKDGTGFVLKDKPDDEKREETTDERNERRHAEHIAATEKPETESERAFRLMRATLKAGIQTVTVPQLFPTPNEIADRMVDELDIRPGHRILEPSAGTGSLVGACAGYWYRGPEDRGNLHAVEINQTLCERLEVNYPLSSIHWGDFLAFAPEVLGMFDRIIMNPPFAGAADIDHILHALRFLKPGGRLVALCAAGPRQHARLSTLGSWEVLPAGSFAEAGTNVNVALLVIDN